MFIGENVTENNADVEEMNNVQSDEETELAKSDADMAQSYKAH